MPQAFVKHDSVTLHGKTYQLEFYALKVVADLVNRKFQAVKMWEIMGWIYPPVFSVPISKGGKQRFRWYCADEVKLFYDLSIVHGIINGTKVPMKSFFAEMKAEQEALHIAFSRGTQIPQQRLPREFLVRAFETRKRIQYLNEIYLKEQENVGAKLDQKRLRRYWRKVLRNPRP